MCNLRISIRGLIIFDPLILQGLLGIIVFFTLAWVFSEKRKSVQFKGILLGLGLQSFLAFIILKVPFLQHIFFFISQGVEALKNATVTGTSFVFGYLGGGDLPFTLKEGSNTFIFAFSALPMIIVVSSLSMLLFYWRILPFLVKGFSWMLSRTLNVGGALGVCSAAKIFLGQTDAPLLIRPYLPHVVRSELFTIMTAGMATTSATIMIIYASILENTISNPIAHILTASIISVPAAISLSRVVVPMTQPSTAGELVLPYEFSGAMDAVSYGAQEGMKLMLSIIAMVLVALALVALTNSMLGLIPLGGEEKLTLQRLFGWVMSPLTWLMGIPWAEAKIAGQILGIKMALNEVIAFITLSKIQSHALSPQTNLIMTYALCGFANLSSIGIQIGGIGLMAPSRRQEIMELAPKALMMGTLASCLSGTIVGILSRF